MRILLLPLLLLLPPPPLLAQTVAPAPRNWSLGFRGGLGLSAYPDFSNYALWSGGGLAGYYLPRARLSLYAEALPSATPSPPTATFGGLAQRYPGSGTTTGTRCNRGSRCRTSSTRHRTTNVTQ